MTCIFSYINLTFFLPNSHRGGNYHRGGNSGEKKVKLMGHRKNPIFVRIYDSLS